VRGQFRTRSQALARREAFSGRPVSVPVLRGGGVSRFRASRAGGTDSHDRIDLPNQQRTLSRDPAWPGLPLARATAQARRSPSPAIPRQLVRRPDRTRQRAVAIKALGDLGHRDRLYAYCNACRYSRQLDLAALRERYGPQLSFKGLRARLRCSRCGARSAQTFHVWDVGSPSGA